jgi:subtilisin-like proprotein convertase family protein
LGVVPAVTGQNIDNYAFSQVSTSSLIDMSSGTTQLIGPNVDFATSAVTNTGFDVWYMGTRYTQFSVNANGILRFGPDAVFPGGNTYMIDGHARLCALSSATDSDDEDPGAGPITGTMATASTGKVHYKVTGTAPTRTLVVEWLNMRINHNSESSSYATFQILVTETNPDAANTTGGRIEFRYGNLPTDVRLNDGDPADITLHVGIGISEDEGKGVDLSGGNPTASFVTDEVANDLDAGDNVPLLHSTSSSARRRLRFEVPATTNEVSTVSLVCQTSSTISLSWTEPASTNGVGTVIYRSTDGTNFSFLAQLPLGTLDYTDTGLSASTTYYYRFYLVNEGKLSSLGATASISTTTETAANVYAVASGNWTATSTWSTGSVPASGTNVIVGCGYTVTVNGGGTCNNLTVQSGATLTFASGSSMDANGNLQNFGTFDLGSNANISLNLAGNLLNNGTWRPGNATVTFDGTSGQTLTNNGTSEYVSDNSTTQTQIFSTTTALPRSIPDDGTTNVAIPVNVTGTIVDINVGFSIEHTFIGDLVATLRSPIDEYAYGILNTDVNCGGDDIDVVLDDESANGAAGNQCGGGVPSIDGTFAPDSPLSIYDGDSPNGTWRLYVSDYYLADVGEITSAYLEITYTTGGMSSQTTNDLAFYNMVVNNTSSGITASNTDVRVLDAATFTDGVLAMSGTHECIFHNNATSTIATNASYVTGRVRKIGDDAFTFPLGADGFAANIGITAPGNTADEFMARYFRASPAGSGYDPLLKEPTINSISTCEFWLLDREVGSSAVSVSLSYDATRSCGLIDPSELVVAHWTGGLWTDEGNGGNASGFTGITSLAPLPSFSPLTLGSNSTPLPISLVDFSALAQASGVALDWETAYEDNASHFEVERSFDGFDFGAIGQVKAHGERSRGGQYGHLDAEAYDQGEATAYYRLKMVDRDGTYEYSAVRQVSLRNQVPDAFALLEVGGNPFESALRLHLALPAAGQAEFLLVDMAGRTVARHQATLHAGTQWLDWDGLHHLPRGMYLLQAAHGGVLQVAKVARQ